jgi:hypothetical protein
MSNKVLKVTHNAGFFSCCSVRLFEIIKYFNENRELPEMVDSSEQFKIHKNENIDITNIFFSDSDESILYTNNVIFSGADNEPQFSDYTMINYKQVSPFISKYFKPSDTVNNTINRFISQYGIETDEICGVFYRGLDKHRETNIADYDTYINKCLDIKSKYNVRFFVQTDESEFLKAFITVFPDTIYISEIPTMSKSDTLLTYHIPMGSRVEFGVNFLSATIILSKCKYLVTHSGNCGKWACLFRGNSDNVYQFITAGKSVDYNNILEYNGWSK